MAATVSAQQPQTHRWAIVVHGGAGDIVRAKLGPDGDAAYRAALTKVVQAGAGVLDHGGSSLDAVEAAIRIMEDDPLFNAGRGAVFAADGNQRDWTRPSWTAQPCAPARLPTSRIPATPSALARAVMEKTPYVLLVGPGADAYSSPSGNGTGRPQLLFHREPLAVARQAIAKGRPAHSAASRGRSSARAPSSQSRNGRRRQTRAATERWAWLRSIARATLLPAPRPAACKARCQAVWAIRRSLARAPTLRINPAQSPAPESASISFASPWRATFARWCNTRAAAAAGRRRSHSQEARAHPWRWRRHCHRSRRPACLELQHAGHVPRRQSEGGKIEVHIYNDEP